MTGIIFNLLEHFGWSRLGRTGYEEILAGCSLKTQKPFAPSETYPYEDFLALLTGVVNALGISRAQVLQEFGKFSFPKLAGLFPAYVLRYPHPKEFLLAIDSVIHAEVVKRFKEAAPPGFGYRDPSPDRLLMEYRSQRGLCHFMEGLIEGVGEVFRSPIMQKQTRCSLRGDPVCEFDLRFER